MNNKVLIVDEDWKILSEYEKNLSQRFEVYSAKNAKEGLEIVKKAGPFAVVVADYRMQGIDGLDFLSVIQKINPETIRIILTVSADIQIALNADNEGIIFTFLTKPCESQRLYTTLNAAEKYYNTMCSEKELLDKTLKGSIKVLIDILSVVNPLAFSQASRYHELAKKLASRLGIRNLYEIEITSLLSQIGCISIPVEILLKKHRGEMLDQSEYNKFKSHPKVGHSLLKNIPHLEKISESILYQNYRSDGSDGPINCKKRNDIPLEARILNVVINFDDLIKRGKSHQEAFKILKEDHGAYDNDVLTALNSEIQGIESGFIVRNIKINELIPGAILSEDIRDNDGVLHFTKGNVVTEALKVRLINIANSAKINDTIKVLLPVKQ